MIPISSATRCFLTVAALTICGYLHGLEGLNPDPCPDPWVCDFPPTLDNKATGEYTTVCVNEKATFWANGTVVPGQKSRCGETEPVEGSVSWSWKLSGPESASGKGAGFTYTPATCGLYDIVWTAVIDADDPCPDSTETLEFSFTVPEPGLETTITSIEICPGKTKSAHWTISNPSECGHWYLWAAQDLSGDPSVTLHDEGAVWVNAGGTEKGDTHPAAVEQITKRGVEQMTWWVYTDCNVGKGRDWTVTVPAIAIDVKAPDITVCPGANDKVHLTIRSNTNCTEVVTWAATLVPDITSLSIGNASGGGETTLEADIVVACPQSTKRGSGTLTITVSVDDEEVAKTTVTIKVPDADVRGSMQDETVCRDEGVVQLPAVIHNFGDCTEVVTYQVTQIAGDIQVAVGGGGGGAIAPGADLLPSPQMISVTIPPGKDRGSAVLELAVSIDGLGVVSRSVAALIIDNWHLKTKPSLKWSTQPALNPNPVAPGDWVEVIGTALSTPGSKACGKKVLPIAVSAAAMQWKLPNTPDLTVENGGIRVGPNAKGSYPITFTATATIPDLNDRALCGGDPQPLHEVVNLVVPEPKADVKVADGSALPNSRVELDWSILNSGQVSDSFSFTFKAEPPEVVIPPAAAPAGLADVGVKAAAPQPRRFALRIEGYVVNGVFTRSNTGGTGRLVPGQTYRGTVIVRVLNGQPGDIGKVVLTAEARGAEAGKGDGKVEVVFYRLKLRAMDIFNYDPVRPFGNRKPSKVTVDLQNLAIGKVDWNFQITLTPPQVIDNDGKPAGSAAFILKATDKLPGNIPPGNPAPSVVFDLKCPKNQAVASDTHDLIVSAVGNPTYPLTVVIRGTASDGWTQEVRIQVSKDKRPGDYVLDPPQQAICFDDYGIITAAAYSDDPNPGTAEVRFGANAQAKDADDPKSAYQDSPIALSWNSRLRLMVKYKSPDPKKPLSPGESDNIQLELFAKNKVQKQATIKVDHYKIDLSKDTIYSKKDRTSQASIKPEGQKWTWSILDAGGRVPTKVSIDKDSGKITVLADDGFGAYSIKAERKNPHNDKDKKDCIQVESLGVVRLTLGGNRTGGFMFTDPSLSAYALVIRQESANAFTGDVQGRGTIRMNDDGLKGIKCDASVTDDGGRKLGKDWTANIIAKVAVRSRAKVSDMEQAQVQFSVIDSKGKVVNDEQVDPLTIAVVEPVPIRMQPYLLNAPPTASGPGRSTDPSKFTQVAGDLTSIYPSQAGIDPQVLLPIPLIVDYPAVAFGRLTDTDMNAIYDIPELKPWPPGAIIAYYCPTVFGSDKEIGWGGGPPPRIMLGYNSKISEGHTASHEVGHALTLAHRDVNAQRKTNPVMDGEGNGEFNELILSEVKAVRAEARTLSKMLQFSLQITVPHQGDRFAVPSQISVLCKTTGIPDGDHVFIQGFQTLKGVTTPIPIFNSRPVVKNQVAVSITAGIDNVGATWRIWATHIKSGVTSPAISIFMDAKP